MKASVASGKQGLPSDILSEEWGAEAGNTDWERVVFQMVRDVARQLIQQLLERLDDQLAAVRHRLWRMVGRRAHTLVTPWGEVTIRRRLYRCGARTVLLLDRVLGWDGRRSYSQAVAELAAQAASWLPFRKASTLLTKLGMPLSAMTIHRLVQRIGQGIARQQQDEAQRLFANGELPPSDDRRVSRLYIEADGVWIALQREAARRAEVWTSITYEGWAAVGRRPRRPGRRRRYRLVGKQVFSEIAAGATGFWQRQGTALHRRYDLAARDGMGAQW